MTRLSNSIAFILVICSLTLTAWAQQYYLYEPKPITAEEKNLTKEGIMVTEVPIQKGDTLYDISRKFSGRGMYYPQILLFNKIKDPKLIYPGNTLKVPVMQGGARAESASRKESTRTSKGLKTGDAKVAKLKADAPVSAQQRVATPPAAATVTEISLSDLRALDEGKPKKSIKKTQSARQGRARDKNKKTAAAAKAGTAPSQAGDSVAGQKLFESAVKAYKQESFSTALELFDRYLANNSSSPLAADASLYKAECYLKLSSQ
jgi:LysM repeat protein